MYKRLCYIKVFLLIKYNIVTNLSKLNLCEYLIVCFIKKFKITCLFKIINVYAICLHNLAH